MKQIALTLLACVIIFNIYLYPQDTSKLNLTINNKSVLISTINKDGQLLVSGRELASAIGFIHSLNEIEGTLTIQIDTVKLIFSEENPFVVYKNQDNIPFRTHQLTQSPLRRLSDLFIPSLEFLELINDLSQNYLVHVSPTQIQVHKNLTDSTYIDKDFGKKTVTIKVTDEKNRLVITVTSSSKPPVFSNFFEGDKLHLILWNVNLQSDSVIKSEVSSYISEIQVKPNEEYTELIFSLAIDDVLAYYEQDNSQNEFKVYISKREYGNWYVKETENFKCIYRDSHSHLVNHILKSSEKALKVISGLFNYQPSEKIVINTYDANDYGYGGTTTIPLNFIRLEIEPLEPGYEIIPYNERIQWLLSHELVHIAVNDASPGAEKFFRNIFGKVNPEKFRPLTVPFSLLTGFNRYTPRWHQESSAVYLETWLSGGFGRVLGNFDEMYFRSLIAEEEQFPDEIFLERQLAHESFLLEALYYIYGGRFITHLAIEYGNEKVLRWFTTENSDFLKGYRSKFEDIFGIKFSDAWKNFIKSEKLFQQRNIEILKTSQLTTYREISTEKFGFVTEPYYSPSLNSVIFGYHRSGELANLRMFNLNNFSSTKMVSLPTPSAISVASTTYDDKLKTFFYTTNNNQLYRDIRIYDIENGKDKMLFKDCRTGHLTISPNNHELWGIQHNGGNAALVRSKYPFDILETLVVFEIGDEIQQLSINNEGDYLAAVLHRSSGQQSIIIADISKLDAGGKFQFSTITSSGSPENPSWSSDDKYLFWNAYTNGVSNIYRCNLETGEILALTHNLTGFFKPVPISTDSLFAFKFSSNGFIPAIIPIQEAERLPAINYLGQSVLNKNPEVMDWTVSRLSDSTAHMEITEEKKYNSLGSLKLQTFIPIISGFQKSKVLGFFAHLADPVLRNEISFEIGVSPFKEILDKVRYHVKFKYDYNQTFYFAVEHNPNDFYDLFNKRKRGTLGNRFAIGHKDFWIYDNPLKVKQSTELSYYTDTRFINDNLVEVSEPDFYVFRTEFEYKNLRRSIGSFDFEQGNHFLFHIIGYGADLEKFEVAPGTYFEWDNYTSYLFPHNVLRFKLAAGYHYLNENLIQAQYFFGGFGNREVENEPVRQYEKVFRFPGVPIYSIPTDKFLKIMISNVFPPLRFATPEILSHYIKNINFSVFSQGLMTDFQDSQKWVNIGAQLNIMFSHWHNLESTLSGGVAKAWWNRGNDWEWFISYKILRD